MATAEGVGVLPERPDGSKPTTAVLTQLVPAIGVPNTQLCSRNVPGLAGETSAGNKLMRSGFHAGRKPSEPGHYKPTYGGDERETEPHPQRRWRTRRVNSTHQYSLMGTRFLRTLTGCSALVFNICFRCVHFMGNGKTWARQVCRSHAQITGHPRPFQIFQVPFLG